MCSSDLVEAVLDNKDGALKPGFFASARIEQAAATPGVLVPSSAVRTESGTQRVFVVAGDHVEERIVTTGQTVESQIEITSGLKAGENVATSNLARLEDGGRIAVSR